MRRLIRKRTDANAKPCDEVFEKHGASVVKLDDLGDDIPDRLIGIWGDNYLIEYKDGAKVPSKRRLSPGQIDFGRTWKGKPVVVILSPEHAKEWLDREHEDRRRLAVQ